MNTDERTDTATTGLNFVTSRPRAEVLRDLAAVLEQLYRADKHYARVDTVTRQLTASRKFRPPARKLLQLATAFVGIARRMTADRETAGYFWRALAHAALTNPAALEVVVGQAVMNENYALQSRSYVAALREQIADVEAMGEAAYNRAMTAP